MGKSISRTSPRKPMRRLTRSRRIREGRDIDLGLLVGSMRGFRTREKVPMSGGLGAMEMEMDRDGVRRAKERRWRVMWICWLMMRR